VQDGKTQLDLLKWVEKAWNNSISYRMGVLHNDYQLIFGPENNAPTRVGVSLRILQKIGSNVSSLRNPDPFLQLYFVLYDYSIFFVPEIPLKYYRKWFCLCSIFSLCRSVEQNVLITNIKLFFKISLETREILSIFVRPKNQFLTWKTITIRLEFIVNRLIRRRIVFSIRIYKTLLKIKIFFCR
jgi:hypothetical protein